MKVIIKSAKKKPTGDQRIERFVWQEGDIEIEDEESKNKDGEKKKKDS